MTRGPFRDLKIWQKGFTICKTIYEITKSFPKEEIYGLTNQLRRAAVSIPSNIAEGNAKTSNKHFIIFLENALGSIFEVETQLEIAKELGFVDDITNLLQELDECGKMISGLIRSLSNSNSNL